MDIIAEIINIFSLPSPFDPLAWPCPRLRHIAFDNFVYADSLKELIKSRGINHTSPESHLTHPDSLRLIEAIIRNTEAHELEELAGSHNIELKYVDNLSKGWPTAKFRQRFPLDGEDQRWV
ncbi:hypothetical protein FRC03_002642 [Tulasnella sp. 419]|nr:hypothetical protein FRC03_002642 [Tulasnella sp. 419]